MRNQVTHHREPADPKRFTGFSWIRRVSSDSTVKWWLIYLIGPHFRGALGSVQVSFLTPGWRDLAALKLRALRKKANQRRALMKAFIQRQEGMP